MFALIDCNNFYASCERVFRPDLNHQPIIVLSNNDGCVIARSNESKALGIKMGEPYFNIKAVCKQHNIQVFSSNFALYGDFSERVMSIIESSWPEIEIYSIDEAFLNLSSMPNQSIEDFCVQLQKKIYQFTGIPTSIGIGETKTLAKVANYIAKKKLAAPVFTLDDKSFWLKKIAVGEVWGIGRQWSEKLNTLNIVTAYDLVSSIALIKNKVNVNVLRTALELRGQFCLDLNACEPKKSIMSSCSFGEMQTTLSALKEAVSYHCAKAWSKMRKQDACARYLSVSIYGNRFRTELAQYSNTASFKLIHPSDDIRVLTKHSLDCLQHIYKEGFHYKKCGVMLTDFTSKHAQQFDLFSKISPASQENTMRVMNAIEAINKKYGARTMHLASEGIKKPWSMKQESKTPCYTTKWSDLPVVYAK